VQLGRIDLRHSALGRSAVGGTVLAFLILLVSLACKYAALPKLLAYACFREISQQKINFQTKSWQTIEGRNFIVRYRPGDRAAAELVLETAEQAYEPVNRMLNYSPREKTLVLVYPDRRELSRSFGWDADQSAMGVYWAGVIRVLSPRQWIKDVTGEGMEEVFKDSGPMVHEYAHLVVDFISGGNYPRWLTEGVAQYVEREITGFVFDDRPIKPGDSWYGVGTIDDHFDTPRGQSKAYRQSLAMVDYLVDRYGEEAVINILNRLGQGVTVNGVWQEQLDVSLADFEENFKKWAGTRTP